MKSTVLRDFTFVFLIYAIYFTISLIVAGQLGSMQMAWEPLSLVVLGVSLLCTTVWYVGGEWILGPSTAKMNWYIFWFISLLVFLGVALAVITRELVPDLNVVFLLGGAGAYYLATMLFSPFHAKFLIWPSTHIRNW